VICGNLRNEKAIKETLTEDEYISLDSIFEARRMFLRYQRLGLLDWVDVLGYKSIR
jgi:hypothetical protein